MTSNMYDFDEDDFLDPGFMECICIKLERDHQELSAFLENGSFLNCINKALEIPSFYNYFSQKKMVKKVWFKESKKMKELIELTKYLYSSSFADLTLEQQVNIKHLNRLLMEQLYSDRLYPDKKTDKKKRLSLDFDPNHYEQWVMTPDDLIIKGRFISVTVDQIYFNVPFKRNINSDVCNISNIFKVTYHNTWKFPVTLGFGEIYGSPKLIDTEENSFKQLYYNDGKWWNELVMGRSKEKEIILFDEIRNNAFPKRLLFRFPIYRAGETEGTALRVDSLELVFNAETVEEFKRYPFVKFSYP